MDLLRYTVDAISEMIDGGMAPIPILASYGLPYSIFDLTGSLRLAFVLRQIRDAERAKAIKLQEKLESEGATDVRELEEPYIVKDLVTILTVIYGGEALCSPWLQFTPSFLTMPIYPLLFMGAQVLINALPSVPEMSIYTELPLSFFDALGRAFLLTTGNPGFIIKHASPAVSSSPWALTVSSLFLANAGFFFVNTFQMLSPYGFHMKTPPEFLPGGWRTMDLWVAPLITGLYALLTQAQSVWIPYHHQVVHKIGHSTLFGTIEWANITTKIDDDTWVEDSFSTIRPMGHTDARSVCALILAVLFLYRAIVNFGIDWAKNTAAARTKRKRVIRSKLDGKRLSKENFKFPNKST
ncbi:hypothetical protein CPB86DRAFT_758712 [Serendipita vermifera]|nr:hypothetical protein CPB86DRAFT_758712 [Serendipita vermifera]